MTPDDPDRGDPDLTEALAAVVAEGPARPSVACRRLADGREWGVDADVRLPTASTFKLFVLAALYRTAASEGVDVHRERVSLREADRSRGSGVLTFLDEGLAPTLYDLAVLMTVVSDNSATDVLLDRVGLDAVQALIADLGLADTHVGATCDEMIGELLGDAPPGLPDHGMFLAGLAAFEAGTNALLSVADLDQRHNWTSPRDLVELLATIWSRDAMAGLGIADPARRELIAVLERQQLNAGIPRYLPAGTTVAHKTGMMPGLIHIAGDAGVFEVPGAGPVALAALTSTTDQGTYPAGGPDTFADGVQRQIGRLAWTAYEHLGGPPPP